MQPNVPKTLRYKFLPWFNSHRNVIAIFLLPLQTIPDAYTSDHAAGGAASSPSTKPGVSGKKTDRLRLKTGNFRAISGPL
jgi:hypothetical protein